MRTRTRLVGRVATVLALATAVYRALVRGALTLDLGVGRRSRPLGPIEVRIAAPPDTVFDVIAAPYLGTTPRAMQDKLRVVERGSEMVLAEHFTPVGGQVTATTVETVRFERPHRVRFRLVRGAVPAVVETFELQPSDTGTTFVYTGTLETDLWALGARWGEIVARKWEQAVQASVGGIKTEAERRAQRGVRAKASP